MELKITEKSVVTHRLITHAISDYMTESEARAVTRWDVGSCLRMVRKTKQVGFELVFESLHSWSISYGGWDFIPNLGGTVAVADTVDFVAGPYTLAAMSNSTACHGRHCRQLGRSTLSPES